MDKINEDAIKKLGEYREKGHIVLVPNLREIKDIQFGYRLFVHEVPVNPDPAGKQVYPHETKQYDDFQGKWRLTTKSKGKECPVDMKKVRVRLSGQTLEQLSQEANILWEQPLLVPQASPNQEVCYIAGSITLADGLTLYRWPDVKGVDLDLERQRIVDKYTDDDTGKVPDNKKFLVERDFQQKKANQKTNCISGARNRVTRKLLGIEQSYLISELEKPIIVPAIVQWLDMSDPETRTLFIKSRILQSTTSRIYGPGAAAQVNMIEQQAAGVTIDKAVFEDDTVDTTCTADEPAPEPEPDGYKIDRGMTMESMLTDFQNSSEAEQRTTLSAMAKTKKWDLADWLTKGKTTLDKVSAEKRAELFKFLCGRPTPEGRKAA